eukprot:4625934-Pyramimonas_sp.AAC.1
MKAPATSQRLTRKQPGLWVNARAQLTSGCVRQPGLFRLEPRGAPFSRADSWERIYSLPSRDWSPQQVYTLSPPASWGEEHLASRPPLTGPGVKIFTHGGRSDRGRPFAPAVACEPFDGGPPGHLDGLQRRQRGGVHHGDGPFVSSHVDQLACRRAAWSLSIHAVDTIIRVSANTAGPHPRYTHPRLVSTRGILLLASHGWSPPKVYYGPSPHASVHAQGIRVATGIRTPAAEGGDSEHARACAAGAAGALLLLRALPPPRFLLPLT